MAKKTTKHPVIHGVTFYPSSYTGVNITDFVANQKGTGLTDEQLKDAYGVLTKKPEAPKAVEAPKP